MNGTSRGGASGTGGVSGGASPGRATTTVDLTVPADGMVREGDAGVPVSAAESGTADGRRKTSHEVPIRPTATSRKMIKRRMIKGRESQAKRFAVRVAFTGQTDFQQGFIAFRTTARKLR